MGKIEEMMRGRTEGMEFALRLVKDKGITVEIKSNKQKQQGCNLKSKYIQGEMPVHLPGKEQYGSIWNIPES